MSTSTRLICRQKGCPLSTTGQCLEGIHPASACPHVVTTSERPKAPPARSDAWTRLPSGDVLDFEAAARILRAEQGRVILLAGAQRSGKTTLALAFHELFQKGPFAGMDFAGSETLVAFERLCHDARVSSENDGPETLRTELEAGTHFLHLRLRATGGASPALNLLFADLSGEHYDNACNNIDECRRIEILRRADLTVLLLDGARLQRANERAKVFKEARGLLRSAIDAGMLGAGSRVRVCFAKWDLLADDTGVLAPIEEIQRRITTDFQGRFASLDFDRIAARPEHRKRSIPLGFGLDTLLRVATTLPPRPAPPPLRFPVPDTDRQADRYLALRVPELCWPED